MKNELELTACLVIERDSLKIEFECVNVGSDEFYLSQVVMSARNKQFPDTAYVSLSAEDEKVTILLGASPLPEDREVEFRVTPLYRRLSIKDKIKSTLRFTLPLLEWDAYHAKSESLEDQVVEIANFVLLLDYLNVTQANRVEETANGDLFRVAGNCSTLICELHSNTKIRVKRRSDQFTRSRSTSSAK